MSRDQFNGLPILYSPEEVGKRLGRSGWWVREQCRRDRFPHTRAAGAIRFTSEQFGEILRILERRPEFPQQQGNAIGRRCRQQAPRTSVVQLRARPPRRARSAPPPDEGSRTA
ncbi:hypothetical protein GCM10012275_40430 [Longimycelium tulufanense]|uniref:Uncharacterized protein n=1 Tax=Longimycelium tulufanense TaxID=907463 RepID=A0A8J3FWE8_9PSEU|nr:hypothetical protein GCM10012275_40430 [Longimycelium tulufanense]